MAIGIRTEDSDWRCCRERAKHFFTLPERALRLEPIAYVLIQRKLAAQNTVNNKRHAEPFHLDQHATFVSAHNSLVDDCPA